MYKRIYCPKMSCDWNRILSNFVCHNCTFKYQFFSSFFFNRMRFLIIFPNKEQQRTSFGRAWCSLQWVSWHWEPWLLGVEPSTQIENVQGFSTSSQPIISCPSSPRMRILSRVLEMNNLILKDTWYLMIFV